MGAFKVISADSHFVEPPDMYTSRIEPKFHERAPRIERHKTPGGRGYDAWMLDGVQVGTLGAVMQAGQRFEDSSQIDFSRDLGGCAERRLRPARDDHRKRRGRCVRILPAAEPGSVLVSRT